MYKFVESFGRWAIVNNIEGVILALISGLIIGYLVRDFMSYWNKK